MILTLWDDPDFDAPLHDHDPYYEEWSRDVERLQNENDALRQHYYDQEAFLIEQEESWQQEVQTD